MTDLTRLLSLGAVETAGFFHVSNPEYTPHKYRGFSRSVYQARGEVEILPDSSTTNDRTRDKFKIPQYYHTLGTWCLRGTFSSLAGNGQEEGAGATVKRFINWAAREQIEEVRFRSGQTTKRNVVIPGRLITIEFYVGTLMRDKEALAIFELGDMSSSERSAAALTDQCYEVWIPNPWDVDYDHFLAISALQDEMEIEIVYKPDREILQYDGTVAMGPIVRKDCTLWAEVFLHYTDQYQHQLEGLFGSSGIEYYKRDCQFDTYAFTASSLNQAGEVIVELDKFSNECAFIFATLRWEDETGANLEGNRGYDNLLPWVNHSITDGPMGVQQHIPYKHQVYRLNVHQTYFPVGLNAIIHSNAMDITDRAHVSGSHNYSGFLKGQFRVKLTPEVILEMQGGRRLTMDFAMVVHNVVSFVSKTNDMTDPRGIFTELYQIN